MKVSFDPLAVITRHGLSDGGAIITLLVLYNTNVLLGPFWEQVKIGEIIDDTGSTL